LHFVKEYPQKMPSFSNLQSKFGISHKGNRFPYRQYQHSNQKIEKEKPPKEVKWAKHTSKKTDLSFDRSVCGFGN